jgi:hypothetical protein
MGQDVNDPFLVLSTGALWQEKYGAVDTRQIGDGLSLSCETSTVTLDEDSEDLSHSEKMGFQFQPIDQLTLHGDLHDSASDAPVFGESTTTNGAAISAESQLPLNAVLTLGMESDRNIPAWTICSTRRSLRIGPRKSSITFPGTAMPRS